MTSPVLNPPQQAAACHRMIRAVEEQRTACDHTLLTRVLEREEYLKLISKRIALDHTLKDMHGIYNKEFNV